MNKIRIRYGTEPSQFGDLRLPNAAGPHPIVVVIHGGFWYDRYGLDIMDPICQDLTTRGFATWNIEYRRVGEPGGGYPNTLTDVDRAVNHLRHLVDQYPLDIHRVIAIGHSAGGHLALWAAARKQAAAMNEGEENIHLSTELLPIAGSMSLAGVSDLRRMWEVRQVDSPVFDFLQKTPEESPERYDAASPIELLPLGVPQVLIHGTADDRVPHELSNRYYDRAVELGDVVTLIELPGVDHFQVIDPASVVWPTIITALEELFTQFI